MRVSSLIRNLENKGCIFRLEGGQVIVHASDYIPPPDILDALQQHNLAVRNYLRTRDIRSLELEMKELTRDAFWEAARPAGIEIENLPHLAEALDWLRRHQPKAHWQLTEFWVERLRDLWENGELREFQEALRVWVQLHVEVCATYGSREKKIGFETNDLPVAFGSTGRGGRNR